MDKKYSEKIANKTLAAYMELCNHLKAPTRGFQALNYHRHRAKKQQVPPITSVNVYNALLKGFATKGNWEKVKEIVEIMEQEGIATNLQSYVAIFECLGRRNIDNYLTREIRIFGKEAINKGFTFDRIMNEGSFLCDERAMVLKAMLAFDPSYQTKIDVPNLQYNNHLLNQLNHESQLDHQRELYEPNTNGLFTPSDMKRRIAEQLDFEINGYITVRIFIS